eukprot:6010033-Pyramimonas_sp.AAC.1
MTGSTHRAARGLDRGERQGLLSASAELHRQAERDLPEVPRRLDPAIDYQKRIIVLYGPGVARHLCWARIHYHWFFAWVADVQSKTLTGDYKLFGIANNITKM